jgi:uncharacterized protein YggE
MHCKSWHVIAASTVLFLLWFLMPGEGLKSQPPEGQNSRRTIKVSGTGTATLKPESARVYFGVQSLASSIKTARSDNAAKVKKVFDSLIGLKLPDLQLKSSDVQVEQIQSRADDNKLPAILGYRMTNTFTVLIQNRDPDKLGEIIGRILDTALESGANEVQNVQFFNKDMSKAKREALALAVKDAKTNAQAIAEGAGVKIIDTFSIEGEPEADARFVQSGGLGTAEGERSTRLVVGDINVSSRVVIECTY